MGWLTRRRAQPPPPPVLAGRTCTVCAVQWRSTEAECWVCGRPGVIQSAMIRRSVGIGVLHPQSGVFVVYSDPPFESALVEWIDPMGIRVTPEEMTGDQLELFETGQPFPDGRRWGE